MFAFWFCCRPPRGSIRPNRDSQEVPASPAPSPSPSVSGGEGISAELDRASAFPPQDTLMRPHKLPKHPQATPKRSLRTPKRLHQTQKRLPRDPWRSKKTFMSLSILKCQGRGSRGAPDSPQGEAQELLAAPQGGATQELQGMPRGSSQEPHVIFLPLSLSGPMGPWSPLEPMYPWAPWALWVTTGGRQHQTTTYALTPDTL